MSFRVELSGWDVRSFSAVADRVCVLFDRAFLSRVSSCFSFVSNCWWLCPESCCSTVVAVSVGDMSMCNSVLVKVYNSKYCLVMDYNLVTTFIVRF